VNAIKLCVWDIYEKYKNLISKTYDTFNLGIPLEIENAYFDNSTDYNEQTISTLKTYNCDIALVDPIWLVTPDNLNNAHSITQYVKKIAEARSKDDVTGLYGDFVEDIKFNNEIYGLPFILDFSILYYNKNKVNSAPTNWEDLLSWAKTFEVEVSPVQKSTKYGSQFTEYREYYYNFVEATASFSNDKNFTLYGEEAKAAVDNYIELFKNDILNERAWNQNSKYMKNSFCNGEIVYMRNWSSFDKTIELCENINYGKALMLKSSDVAENSSLVRSLSFVATKLVSEENLETVAKVIEKITSKEFLNALISDPQFFDVPPYLELIKNNPQFCSNVDCNFYNKVTKNLITKPIGRFIRKDFSDILDDSYNSLKNHYKNKEKGSETIMELLSDFYEDKYIKWDNISAIIMISIVAIGIIVTIVIFILVVKNRTALVIRRSSPLFLYFMLIGILISFGSVLTFIGKPNEIVCMIRPIILVLAFCLAFIALFLKTFRIKVIFDKSNVKVQDKHLLIYGSIILVIELVIVGAWTVLDKMQPTVKYVNSKMHYYTCNNTGKIGASLQIALLIINAITLLYGCYLAVKVKNVYSDYNESKVIGLSIYGIMTCMVIQLIVSAFASLGLSVIFIVQSLMIILSSVILLLFMFVPKLWKLKMTANTNENSNGMKKSLQRYPNSNNQNNSYSGKNGYINMQNVDYDYYNQMGQMSQMGQMGQMGSVDQINYMNQMNYMGQMDQIVQMNQIDQIDQIEQIDQINRMGSMNQMGLARMGSVNQVGQINRMGSMNQVGQISHMGSVNQVGQISHMGSVNQMGQIKPMGTIGQKNNVYNDMNGSSESLNGKNYYDNLYNYI